MPGTETYSEDPKINLIIRNILNEIRPFLEEQAAQISEMAAVGKALGTDRDTGSLLEMILSTARKLSRADGGTLYLSDAAKKHLQFLVIQNESLEIFQYGGDITLSPVPLYNKDNTPNLSNVSSFVFHTKDIVNITDVYKTDKFNFNGVRQFDRSLNYTSKSMLVIPMKNHENDIIGILQLINAKDPESGDIISFSSQDQEKAAAMASQSSVILTQQTLILELTDLFESFTKAIAVSIDEKSKHTGDHIQRVTKLADMIAREIHHDTGVFKHIRFTRDQLDELRIAALMHDTGKISTPDHIISKASRLETVFDRIELIKTRWELFKTNRKLKAARQMLSLLNIDSKKEAMLAIDKECQEDIRILEDEYEVLSQINSSKIGLNKRHLKQLDIIAEKSCGISGERVPYLTEDEIRNLSIEKGTLTQDERGIINRHATLTGKVLSTLPWPKKLLNVPAIAGAHHEKLDGSGYPLGLDASKLTIQSRILAVADIFEALSAQDRPYKSPMTLTQIINILKEMARNNHIDKQIVDIFLSSKAHIKYAQAHLSPSQCDLETD